VPAAKRDSANLAVGTVAAEASRMRIFVASLLLGACGHHGSDGQAADASGAGMDTGPGADASCGAQHLGTTYIAPNLLLTLDRSCSMKQKLSGTNTTKWEAAVAAVTHAVSTYDTTIRWGATLFPDTSGDSCTQDAIPFPIADGNAQAITAALTGSLNPANPLYPSGPCVTNIDTGVEQAATDPALADAGRSSYLMLVTDGMQANCSSGGGNNGTEAAIQALHDMKHVTTFVVGFGSDVDATELNKLAVLGGAPRAGATKFYKADTAMELDQVFQSIAQNVLSCKFHLDPPPPDPNETWVFLDHTLVGHDPGHSNGWDYDPATQDLTLYGAACDELHMNPSAPLDVVFGCPVL
jgi:hypothetical protein